jgi:hypothetical protein
MGWVIVETIDFAKHKTQFSSKLQSSDDLPHSIKNPARKQLIFSHSLGLVFAMTPKGVISEIKGLTKKELNKYVRLAKLYRRFNKFKSFGQAIKWHD